MTDSIKSILFWIAVGLIAEPIVINAWPRIKAAMILAFPINQGKIDRVERYYKRLEFSHRLGLMMPLRRNLRRYMQSIGILILIGLVVINEFKINSLWID